MENEENKEIFDDTGLDKALRPSAWDDYIGQENIKQNLKILLAAAKERNHPAALFCSCT